MRIPLQTLSKAIPLRTGIEIKPEIKNTTKQSVFEGSDLLYLCHNNANVQGAGFIC